MPRKKTPRTVVMNTREAAIYVGLSESTLEKMRVQGDKGPPFAALEGSVRYRIADLEEWIADRILRSTRGHKRKPRGGTPRNS